MDVLVITFNDEELGEKYNVAAYNISAHTAALAWLYQSEVSNGVFLDSTTSLTFSPDGAVVVLGTWGDETHVNPQVGLFPLFT